MSDGAGQVSEKETICSGPEPEAHNPAFPPSAMAVDQSTIYGGFTPAPTGSTPLRSAPVVAKDASQVAAGASWFYWIAGLSLINSVILLSGSHWHFALGLGIADVMSGIGSVTGATGAGVSFVINLVIAGVVVLFGFFAGKGQKWAFLVGMVLYGLDGGILLLARDFLSVAFHGYALFRIYKGFKNTD